jgi:hypothetical protein
VVLCDALSRVAADGGSSCGVLVGCFEMWCCGAVLMLLWCYCGVGVVLVSCCCGAVVVLFL